MSDVFQIASVGMLEGRQRLEAISLNAASASVPGYRRHVVTGQPFDAVLSPTQVKTASVLDMPLAAQRESTTLPLVNLQPAEIKTTSRVLDVAIDAPDEYFALTDGTQTWLTRAGQFHVDREGVLVGEQGLRVVGAQGDLHLPGDEVQISSDGRITHDGVLIGTLQLFRAIAATSLRAAQGALLLAPQGMLPVDLAQQQVSSGALEASNTDSGREMISLITLSRQFEGLSRIVQSYDEALGRVIEKLGQG